MNSRRIEDAEMFVRDLNKWVGSNMPEGTQQLELSVDMGDQQDE